MPHPKVQAAYDATVDALQELEGFYGPNYKLTFIARCHDESLGDSDVLVTADGLADIKRAIERRIKMNELAAEELELQFPRPDAPA